MNKKVIAIIISLLLAVSSIPAQVFATDDVSASVSANSIDEENQEETPDQDVTAPEDNNNEDNKESEENRESGDENSVSDGQPDENDGNSGQEQQEEQPQEEQPQEQQETQPVQQEQQEQPYEETYTEETVFIPVEYTEEYTDTEVIEEQTEVEVQAEVLTAEEEDWMSEHNLERNDDGDYEYTDEEGHKQKFTPGDPEVYKFFGDADEKEITLGDNKVYLRPGSEYYDPYVFKLNNDYKYRYPGYFRSENREDRPEVHYGMDVSKYQGSISKENYKILKDDYGIDFVIVRVGYRGYGEKGSLNTDSCYRENIKNAYRAGLAVGVYYFSQAISTEEAEEEAEHTMKLIAPYKRMITLPVITDYEYSGSPGRLRGAHLDAYEQTEIVNAFCARVQEEGYIPGIYANKSMLLRDMEVSEIPEDYHIWMANFVGFDEDGVGETSYGKRLSSWQFTSKFSGFGDRGLQYMKGTYLDLNFWYGDFPKRQRHNADEETEASEEDSDEYTAEEADIEDETAAEEAVETIDETEPEETQITAEEETSEEETSEDTIVRQEAFSEAESEPAPEEETPAEEEYSEGSEEILISRSEVSGLQSEFLYTGSEITQSGYELRCVRKWGEAPTVLKEGRDYTVSYVNNIDTGWNKAKIIFKGRGDFVGTVTKRYTIKPVKLSEDGVQNESIRFLLDESVPYSKGGTKPAPKISLISGDSEFPLEEGRDYTLKYYNNKGTGKRADEKRPQVLVTGKGNYTGEIRRSFDIKSPDISDGDMTVTDVVYERRSGNCRPKIKVYSAGGSRLAAGLDYEKEPRYFYEEIQAGSMIEHYEKGQCTKLDRKPGDEVGEDDIIPAGTVVRAEITGKGKYAGSKISKTFRIIEAE